MKKSVALAALALALPLSVSADVPSPAAAAPSPVAALRQESFYDTWIKDRLSLGLGVSWSKLTDAKREKDASRQKTFVGYVWKLEDTDQVGLIPELRWWASPNLRLTLALDRISGRTRNFNLEKHSDGTAELTGPQFLVEGIYPMCDDTLFLHAGVGFVYDFADFPEVTWWKLGYSSRESWEYLGRPTKSRQGYFREIRVDDAFGLTVSAGVSWRPAPRAELDLSLRHTWIEPDCEFGYYYGKKRGFEKHSDGEFTLDHLTVAITGSYVF